MSETLTPGVHHRTTEFVYDPAQGRWLTGTCGPTALAMAAWNATNTPHDVLSVYRLMRGRGLCDPTGGSTPAALNTAAELLGLSVAEYQPYIGDSWSGWRAFLDRHAGRDAVVLELAHGQALKDEISGLGENATNLDYHYICGYGPSGDGWLFADGDNFAVGDVLQRYSFATLAAAQPCAAVAIAIPANTNIGGVMVPSGWHDDGTTLTAPNGKVVSGGFRLHVLNYAGGWPSWDWPLENDAGLASVELGNPQIGAGDRQIFRSRMLGYTKTRDVYEAWTGQELMAWIDAASAAQAKIADLEAQIATGAHDDVAVAAIKTLALALTSVANGK